jgi:hypothetical protein
MKHFLIGLISAACSENDRLCVTHMDIVSLALEMAPVLFLNCESLLHFVRRFISIYSMAGCGQKVRHSLG